MSVPKIFLDTETGGFDDSRHPLLEVAYAVEDAPVHSVRLPHDVRACDDRALAMNGYDERRLGDRRTWANRMEINSMWATFYGSTLVCSNPSFDERFLLAYGRAEALHMGGKVDVWRHRKIDIAAYAMPLLGHDEPHGLEAIVEELRDLGHEIPWPDHSATNDVLALRGAFRVLEQMVAPTNGPVA